MHRTAYVTTAQPHPTTRPSSPLVKPKAMVFAVTCVLHSLIALFCGSMMMFHSQAIYSLGHGTEAAERLLGSTPHDRLLIGTSDSFAELLFAIGLLPLMVSNIQDREFVLRQGLLRVSRASRGMEDPVRGGGGGLGRGLSPADGGGYLAVPFSY